MSAAVLTKTFSDIPANLNEVLQFAGCQRDDRATEKLALECLNEAEGCFSYKVCFCETGIEIKGDLCDFGDFTVESRDLAQHLKGCKRVIVFAATVGVGIDRLIAKYSRLSPARAVIFQAIGAQRIEALCDAFCAEFASARPRFSPGYGDLPLNSQRDIFALLGCEKNLGITLNDSLLMSPTKSVTAFLGLDEG